MHLNLGETVLYVMTGAIVVSTPVFSLGSWTPAKILRPFRTFFGHKHRLSVKIREDDERLMADPIILLFSFSQTLAEGIGLVSNLVPLHIVL